MTNEPRTKVTPQQFGLLVAHGLIHILTKDRESLGAKFLAAELKADRPCPQQARYLTEVLLVGAFAADLVLDQRIESAQEARLGSIQEARVWMRSALLKVVNSMREDIGEPFLAADVWDDLVIARFSTYGALLYTPSAGANPLLKMVQQAYRNVTDQEDLDMGVAMHLAVDFGVLFKHRVFDWLNRYEVV
jgi:hypothetical protein